MSHTKDAGEKSGTQAISIILILFAALCWGVIGIFSRALSDAGAAPIQITAVRCVVTALLLAGYMLVFNRKLLCVKFRDLWMFFGTGICSILFFNVCYFYTQSVTSLSVAAILLYTSPFFVMLISAVVFRERITPAKLTALLAAFCGCVLITGVLGGSGAVPAIAVLSGIGSGLGYGLYSIFGKLALRKYDILTVTVYTFIFAAVGSVPFCEPGEVVVLVLNQPSLIVHALLLGILCTLTPFVLYTKGLSGIESGKAAVAAYAEPVIATLTGAIVFGERITWEKAAGVLLVMAAIILLSYRKKQTR